MYAELKTAKVTARTLTPTTIFVDTACEKMTFTDITALAYHGEPVFGHPVLRMPYNNQFLDVNPLTRLTSPDWDLWSIGIIALEIIVGTELVLLADTYEDVQQLMYDVRAFIPVPTHQLLTELLFHVRDEQALVNSKSDYFEAMYQFADAINGMEDAKKGNSILKKRVETFYAYANDHAEEMKAAYHWSQDDEKQ